jgi:hypothetical protein
MRITLQYQRHDGAEHDDVDGPSHGFSAIGLAPLDSGKLQDGRS